MFEQFKPVLATTATTLTILTLIFSVYLATPLLGLALMQFFPILTMFPVFLISLLMHCKTNNWIELRLYMSSLLVVWMSSVFNDQSYFSKKK